jgi:hypothetical protein
VRTVVLAYISAVGLGCMVTDVFVPLLIAFLIALPIEIWLAFVEVRNERIDAEVAAFRAEMMQELP